VRRLRLGAPVCLFLLLAGCRARLINASIVNQGPALQLLEFDYPSASFGVDKLPAGGVYDYRFAVQGAGELTLHFQDSAGHNYTANGPAVSDGQEGSLTVTIDRAQHVTWQLAPRTSRLQGPR
jgi:hypothetical protein